MDSLILGLTLEQAAAIVIFIGGLIGGIKYLKKELKDALKDMLKDQFKGVNDKLDNMQHRIDKIDEQACKNFLIRYLADIERGDKIYDSEKQRFWEEYDHYVDPDEVDGNSYIKEWVSRLKKEGKLDRPGGE